MIDLHCHSKVSDGSLAPFELVQLAKLCGVTHLAVTDHDTTRGYTESLYYGQMLGVEIIPGIEISAYDYRRNKRAHILGYFIEPGHPAIDEICRPLVEQRNRASMSMVEKIIEAGFEISWAEVENIASGGTGVYKQHIMHALVQRGYCDGIHSDLTRLLFSRGEESDPPGIAYNSLDYIDAIDAIAAINTAGGVAVLAHPGEFYNFDTVPEWVQAGLQGIEVYHPSHDQESIELSLELARRFDLVMTGGSDYHGAYNEKPAKLGCSELDVGTVTRLNNLSNWNILVQSCI